MIHAVTNDEILLRPDFLIRARGVMKALGNRGAIHIRARLLPDPRLFSTVVDLLLMHGDTGCWCVISDRVDVALGAGAQAVQLTSRSIAVLDVKKIAPALLVGASVHSTAEATAAATDGADWCVAGNVFETESHPGAARRESAFIAGIAGSIAIPVIAIGGIKPEHVRPLAEAGAYGVAAIRGIWEAENSEAAASYYLSEYDRDGNTPSNGNPPHR